MDFIEILFQKFLTRNQARMRANQLRNRATDIPFSALPHARQDRHLFVDIVDDENLGLPVMQAVEATDVLSQRASPGNGHREEERVKPLIVEALAKIMSPPALSPACNQA
ncbi:hypothetical protein NKJ26_31240 [Mesorhizobium sp. M0152]|uniref:hypothetical protein n=1 Tax=Mesorhizobium sp. M0152 TaxID=2956898 RepID=UPI0033363F36